MSQEFKRRRSAASAALGWLRQRGGRRAKSCCHPEAARALKRTQVPSWSLEELTDNSEEIIGLRFCACVAVVVVTDLVHHGGAVNSARDHYWEENSWLGPRDCGLSLHKIHWYCSTTTTTTTSTATTTTTTTTTDLC